MVIAMAEIEGVIQASQGETRSTNAMAVTHQEELPGLATSQSSLRRSESDGIASLEPESNT